MMRFVVSEDNDTATLECEFCGEPHGWPLRVHLYWIGDDAPARLTEPDIQRVVQTHWSKDENMARLGFPECRNVAAWRSTKWEVFDADEQRVRGTGDLIVAGGHLYFE